MSSPPWVGRAPGKLILLGEHAVVAGHPAIAAAVDRYTTVALTPAAGVTRVVGPAPEDARLGPALGALLPPTGLEVGITSEIPIGCGMGSSAALAVALVRALAAREGRDAGFEECFERAFAVERVFHGSPSGVDHAVSALGGVVRYLRAGPRVTPLRGLARVRLVVANTGQPGNTAEMVARVRARGPEAEFREIAAVVEAAQGAWPRVGPLLDANHALLVRLGVSTPRLDATCAAMRAAGAQGAKLAGAGGGGVCFALVDPEAEGPVARAAADLGNEVFAVSVGDGPGAGYTTEGHAGDA